MTLVGILAMAVGFPAASAGAPKPTLFLSWHAPYGMPRASDSVVLACDDTAHVDTLYLCFEIGRLKPRVLSIAGSLYFYPVPGDSLRDFWLFVEDGGPDMFVDFAPFPDLVVEPPWDPPGGKPEVSYHFSSGSARLDLSLVVHAASTIRLEAGRRYCFARVRFHHRHAGLPGCEQPVCMQWGSARLSLANGRRIETRGGTPHVTWNSPDGAACGKRHGSRQVRQPQPTGTTGNGP